MWLFLCLYLPVQRFLTTADSQHHCIYRFLSLIILIVLLPFYLFIYFQSVDCRKLQMAFFQTNGLVACPGFIPFVLEGALSLLLPDTREGGLGKQAFCPACRSSSADVCGFHAEHGSAWVFPELGLSSGCIRTPEEKEEPPQECINPFSFTLARK